MSPASFGGAPSSVRERPEVSRGLYLAPIETGRGSWQRTNVSSAAPVNPPAVSSGASSVTIEREAAWTRKVAEREAAWTRKVQGNPDPAPKQGWLKRLKRRTTFKGTLKGIAKVSPQFAPLALVTKSTSLEELGGAYRDAAGKGLAIFGPSILPAGVGEFFGAGEGTVGERNDSGGTGAGFFATAPEESSASSGAGSVQSWVLIAGVLGIAWLLLRD